ncbi:Abi family protein [Ligilactobacillus aviarius]|uniref:Abi family protein n=1 Tax=Ligilactobacillus aviarius TaxID=1606 RepID=UPI0024B9B591|nr:Abi family protein [Ligilactobacillus aviarius]
MFFLKEFKSISEQIELLKSRGLIINDEEKATKYLLTNNYYNIINGYSKPFLESENNYIQGSTFDEVSHLYFFDKEIKETFFKAILNIERHVKSLLAHRFEEVHRNHDMAYLDINSYDHTKSVMVSKLITKLDKIVNINKRYRNNPIQHYMDHYHKVPLWVLADYLDFGTLCHMIKVLPISIQNKISMDLINFIKDNNPNLEEVTFTPNEMISFLNNIHEIRNICAHNGRLIYFKCKADTVYYPLIHEKYNIDRDDEKRNVYTAFISMECFLTKTEFAILNNTIRKRMRSLKNQICSISVDDIIGLLGFPNEWFNRPTMPQ